MRLRRGFLVFLTRQTCMRPDNPSKHSRTLHPRCADRSPASSIPSSMRHTSLYMQLGKVSPVKAFGRTLAIQKLRPKARESWRLFYGSFLIFTSSQSANPDTGAGLNKISPRMSRKHPPKQSNHAMQPTATRRETELSGGEVETVEMKKSRSR